MRSQNYNYQRGVLYTKPARLRRSAGFTLVEIAVALAIFVIGALAIIRIFPPALGVIQGSESRAIGMRISRGTLARLASEPGLMPDSTYDYDPASTQPGFWVSPYAAPGLPIAVVGSPIRNASIPRNALPSGFANSGLGHFKRIIGEKHKIQVDASGPRPFILTRYPYTGQARIYREGQINGVQISEDGTLNFRNASLASDPSVSFSDPGSPGFSRPPDDMRDGQIIGSTTIRVFYYVTYRWMENGEIQGVVDEPVAIPEDTTWSFSTDYGKVLQGKRLTLSANTKVLAGTVPVRFRYQVLPTSPDPPITATTIEQRLGYAPIDSTNPGQTLTTLTTPLRLGDTVSVDYDVDDWRWITHDDTPDRIPAFVAPTPTPIPSARSVTLPVRPIDEGQPIQVFALLTGTDITPGATNGYTRLVPGTWDSAGVATGDIKDVDLRKGRVTFDLTQVVNGTYQGPRARTVYQTLDGWVHQLSVAARSYVPFYTDYTYNTSTPTHTPREPWREYVWSGNSLYFHPSEAGKSVMVSFRYNDGGTLRDAVSILTINDNVGTPPFPNPSTFGDTQVASVEITDQTGQTIAASDIKSIISVQGVGVQARTAWQDNGRYQQVNVASYRSPDQL